MSRGMRGAKVRASNQGGATHQGHGGGHVGLAQQTKGGAANRMGRITQMGAQLVRQVQHTSRGGPKQRTHANPGGGLPDPKMCN